MGSDIPVNHDATAGTRSTKFYARYNMAVAERVEDWIGRLQEPEPEESPLPEGSGMPTGGIRGLGVPCGTNSGVDGRGSPSPATNISVHGEFTGLTPGARKKRRISDVCVS